jgi:hypothetical protein
MAHLRKIQIFCGNLLTGSPALHLWKVDTPESAHMRCVAEEAINAVLNRIKIRSIEGNVVSIDVVAPGHSDDRGILVANLALSDVVTR